MYTTTMHHSRLGNLSVKNVQLGVQSAMMKLVLKLTERLSGARHKGIKRSDRQLADAEEVQAKCRVYLLFFLMNPSNFEDVQPCIGNESRE